MSDDIRNDNEALNDDDLRLLYTLGEALGDKPTEDETQEAWARFEAAHRGEEHRRRRLRPALAAALAAAAVIAAVVLMPWGRLTGGTEEAGAYVAARLPESVTRSAEGSTVTVTTPPATTAEVSLPDGSTALLGAGSRLEYPKSFDGAATRAVKLNGMARFKVKHDGEKPFIVHADGLTTKVLGTEFDVRSYPGVTHTVTLYSGKVSVRAEGARRDAVLKPGQQIALDGSKGMRITAADISTADGWTHGMFVFDDTRLQDVVNEIGSWYNKSVVFRSKKDLDTRVHFTLPRAIPIEDVLRALRDMGITKLRYDGEKIEVM